MTNQTIVYATQRIYSKREHGIEVWYGEVVTSQGRVLYSVRMMSEEMVKTKVAQWCAQNKV